jgi:hypothetical protein
MCISACFFFHFDLNYELFYINTDYRHGTGALLYMLYTVFCNRVQYLPNQIHCQEFEIIETRRNNTTFSSLSVLTSQSRLPFCSTDSSVNGIIIVSDKVRCFGSEILLCLLAVSPAVVHCSVI